MVLPQSIGDESSDEELARKTISNPDAFAAFYARYATPLYRYVRRQVQTDQDAEEVTADVFAAAFVELRSGKARPTAPRAWLYGIARHKTLDYYRARYAHRLEDLPAEFPGEEDAQDGTTREESHRQLKRLLAQLPEFDREVLELRYWDDLSWREIAAIVHKSEGAVRVAAHRTLRRLRSRWG